MFPVIFHFGGFSVRAHQVFEMLSYAIGVRYYLYQRRLSVTTRTDLERERRRWIFAGGALGAMAGSKLLGFLEHPHLLAICTSNIACLMGSKTIVGGLLGGVLGVEFAKKLTHETRSTGDAFCFPIILGMIIGRIGCFLEGPGDGTWGNATSFWAGIDTGDGIVRHPAPLYEIIVLLAIWAALAVLRRRVRLIDGALFRLFMASYLLWRFAAEFIKPVDLIQPLGLSAIQLACLGGLLYYWRTVTGWRNLVKE